MEATQTFFEKAKLGGKQTHQNMTLVPLLAPDAGEPDYLILEEALGQGVVEITEVSEGGWVPVPSASSNLLGSMKIFHIML